MNGKINFKQGIIDGIPIGLGYLSVSIGIGITAVAKGMSILQAVVMSMTNLTSAGEAAGITVIATLGTILEMVLIQFVINLRYSMMAISLSQKLDSSFTVPKRIFLGAFITDEIFGVSSSHKSINTRYMYGLVIVPFIGWAVGTFLGAYMGKVLPESVNSALGIAIYGMFIAIFIPAMKKSKDVLLVVLFAIALSTLLRYIPIFASLNYGFNIIISSVVSSTVMAYISSRRDG